MDLNVLINLLCRPPQLAFQGTYRGLIELLIVHASEIFPPHQDDENDEILEDNLDELDDSEELTQTTGEVIKLNCNSDFSLPVIRANRWFCQSPP